MLFAELLAASERVAGTRSRLAKIDALAEYLRRLDASEIALGVAYLSGDTRQGKIGIGYATLKDALAATPASAPRLTLAQPAEDVADAIERLGPAAFEWKLDGARVQAHKSGGEIRVYTRSLNEVTSAVPEIVLALQECPARALIADGETIALRPEGTP